MPHQPTTVAAGADNATASWPRPIHRLTAAAAATHANLAAMTTTHTAAATAAYHAPVSPPDRAANDLSWNPTRMNASTFSTNTATSHTAHDGTRIRAGNTSGVRRAVAIANTTIVM